MRRRPIQLDREFDGKPPLEPMCAIASGNKDLECILARYNHELLCPHHGKLHIERPMRSMVGGSIGDAIAIDTECVGGLDGQNILARMSIVNLYGVVLVDTIVHPLHPIGSYRTKYSGINRAVYARAKAEKNIMSFNQARRLFLELANHSIVIGHSLNSDLSVMRAKGLPRARKLVDTQKMCLFTQHGLSNQPGLKKCLKRYYDIDIQQGNKGHSSVEDARACMLLFRTFEEHYMK